MHSVMKIIYLLLIFSITTCRSNQSVNDYIIDSTRIGNIKICNNLSDINNFYSQVIDTTLSGDEDVSWLGKKIILSDSEWILVEASWIDSTRIWRISTNSSIFTTVNGFKVGDSIKKMKENNLKIDYDESFIYFTAQSKQIEFGFNIESNYAEIFYKKVDECNHCSNYLDFLNDNASIQEITISGSCK